MHMKSLEHQETENPRESSQAFFTKTVAAAAGTALGDSPKKMGQTSNIQQEGIEKLLHIAYFIASKGCPYTDFSDLVELAKLHEVKSVPSGSYENETACKDFISFCSEAIFDANIRDRVDRTSFISVLCDGSTVSGVVEKECIYILFVDPDTFQVKVTFFH